MLEFFKYLGIFLAAFTEGPTTAVSVGFLSRLGYMNIYLGYLAHVLGDMSADFLYYFIGYFGGAEILPRFSKFFGFSLKEYLKAKKVFLENRKKIIIFGKLTHLVGLPVLFAAGVVRYTWWKFGILNFLATLIKSAILVIIGYYFGEVWRNYSNVFVDLSIAMTLLFLIPVGYFVYKRRKQVKAQLKSSNEEPPKKQKNTK